MNIKEARIKVYNAAMCPDEYNSYNELTHALAATSQDMRLRIESLEADKTPACPPAPAWAEHRYQLLTPGLYDVTKSISVLANSLPVPVKPYEPPPGVFYTQDDLARYTDAVRWLEKHGYAFRLNYGVSNAIEVATERGWKG